MRCRPIPASPSRTRPRVFSAEEEARIEECFRDENLWLLNTCCSGIDVDRIYHTYFTPQEAEFRYSSMTDLNLIYRCLGIILESIAASGDQVGSGESGPPKASKAES